MHTATLLKAKSHLPIMVGLDYLIIITISTLIHQGLTGLAQVKGRNAISWQQKFEYDIEYVNQIGRAHV